MIDIIFETLQNCRQDTIDESCYSRIFVPFVRSWPSPIYENDTELTSSAKIAKSSQTTLNRDFFDPITWHESSFA